MLKTRIDSLQQSTEQHYRKQQINIMEAKKNIQRRKANLEKLNDKVKNFIDSSNAANNDVKMERFEEEFIGINRAYDSPFHQFKYCTVGLNPQCKFIVVIVVSGQVFEGIGNLKYPIV